MNYQGRHQIIDEFIAEATQFKYSPQLSADSVGKKYRDPNSYRLPVDGPGQSLALW